MILYKDLQLDANLHKLAEIDLFIIFGCLNENPLKPKMTASK